MCMSCNPHLVALTVVSKPNAKLGTSFGQVMEVDWSGTASYLTPDLNVYTRKLPLLYLQSVETSPCLVQPKLCSLMKTFALSCFNDSLGTEVECKKPGSMNNVPEGDRCLALKAKLWHQPHLQGYRTGSPLCRWVQAWDSPTGERHKMTEPQNGLGCKKP